MKNKFYGYNCVVCGDPIKEPQATMHTDDGLAHSKCCQPEQPIKGPRHSLVDFKKLLAEIHRVTRRKLAPKGRATLIRALLDDQSCYRCRADWKRGGNRQGSELCQRCYDGDI